MRIWLLKLNTDSHACRLRTFAKLPTLSCLMPAVFHTFNILFIRLKLMELRQFRRLMELRQLWLQLEFWILEFWKFWKCWKFRL